VGQEFRRAADGSVGGAFFESSMSSQTHPFTEERIGDVTLPRVFTTGQVARICGVTPQTVTKWTDNGTLPCYRIPGGVDRRVSRDELVALLTATGMWDSIPLVSRRLLGLVSAEDALA